MRKISKSFCINQIYKFGFFCGLHTEKKSKKARKYNSSNTENSRVSISTDRFQAKRTTFNDLQEGRRQQIYKVEHPRYCQCFSKAGSRSLRVLYEEALDSVRLPHIDKGPKFKIHGEIRQLTWAKSSNFFTSMAVLRFFISPVATS